MDISTFGITGVASITVICFLLAEIIKPFFVHTSSPIYLRGDPLSFRSTWISGASTTSPFFVRNCVQGGR